MANQERQVSNTGGKQIGYFCHLRLGEKHIGAVLVTDQIGIPLEFKYTEPVIATKLHKILYGPVLERYLHETVLRGRLAREVKSDPDFFIASYEEKEFLGTLAGKEMMAVQKYKLPPGESSGSFTRLREREAIVEIEEGPMLRLVFSTHDNAVQQKMITWLQEIGRTMDILEPMERVSNALKSLCGNEKRD